VIGCSARHRGREGQEYWLIFARSNPRHRASDLHGPGEVPCLRDLRECDIDESPSDEAEFDECVQEADPSNHPLRHVDHIHAHQTGGAPDRHKDHRGGHLSPHASQDQCRADHRDEHADGFHQPEVHFRPSHLLKGIDADERLQARHEVIHALRESDVTAHPTPASAHGGAYVTRV
jgi:hypothetical protein